MASSNVCRSVQANTLKARKIDREERRILAISEMIADGACYARTGERHCLYHPKMVDCRDHDKKPTAPSKKKHALHFKGGAQRMYTSLADARESLNSDPSAEYLYNSDTCEREYPATAHHYFMFDSGSNASAAYVAFIWRERDYAVSHKVIIHNGKDVFDVSIPANRFQEYDNEFKEWRRA